MTQYILNNEIRKGEIQWIRKGELKGYTEASFFNAQEQALRTSYIKYHIDKTIN